MGVYRCTETVGGGGGIIGNNAMWWWWGYYTVSNSAMYKSRGLRDW